MAPWAVLEHVAHEGPGLIATAAARAGHQLQRHRLHAGERLPSAHEIGGLVVMGGPMGADDLDQHPWLDAERELVAEAVALGRPLLGVCLGAQVLARALGAPVTRDTGAEVGLGEVRLTEDGQRDPVLGPSGPVLPVLHWHQDTFDVPDGAVHLAISADCPHQAFRCGSRAYAFQFHIELDPPLARRMQPHLPAGVIIDQAACERVQAVGEAVLERFFALVPAAPKPPVAAPKRGGHRG